MRTARQPCEGRLGLLDCNKQTVKAIVQQTVHNKATVSKLKLAFTTKQKVTCDRVVWQIFDQHVLVFCQSSHMPAALAHRITVDS